MKNIDLTKIKQINDLYIMNVFFFLEKNELVDILVNNFFTNKSILGLSSKKYK